MSKNPSIMLEQYIGYGTTYYFLSLSYKSLEKKKNYSIVQN